jgi:hypothetical protein
MMNRITVNEHNFTAEEREALTICHNKYFIAEMADRYSDQIREEERALKELKQIIPNVVEFHPNFSNGSDVVVIKE